MGDYSETVDIVYDTSLVTYGNLLDVFWTSHDVTTSSRRQYRSAIYYHSREQRHLAEQTKKEEGSKRARPITTAIEKAAKFYNAEDYHQKYFLRQHRDLLLSVKLSDEELVISTVAARLNGYLAGYGSRDQLDQERKLLGLSLDQAHLVRKYIKN